jgi:hypothetical protein
MQHSFRFGEGRVQTHHRPTNHGIHSAPFVRQKPLLVLALLSSELLRVVEQHPQGGNATDHTQQRYFLEELHPKNQKRSNFVPKKATFGARAPCDTPALPSVQQFHHPYAAPLPHAAT